MRLISLLITILVISWTSFWLIVSGKREDSIIAWFNQTEQVNERSFAKISKSGFPNRADITIEKFFISTENPRFSISAEIIQLLSLIYNKNHLISIIQPPLNLKFDQHFVQITGKPVKASLKIDKKNNFLELIGESQNLTFTDQINNSWTLKQFLVALKRTSGVSQNDYKTHLTINDITIPEKFSLLTDSKRFTNSSIKKVVLEGNIQIEQKSNKTSQNPLTVRISDFKGAIHWGSINSNLNGYLEISDDGILEGAFLLSLDNWRYILSEIENKKFVDKKVYKKIRGAVNFLASQSIAEPVLNIPVKIKNNSFFLGPIKIGSMTINTRKY